jgi:Tfp pilus assembly protein FimV
MVGIEPTVEMPVAQREPGDTTVVLSPATELSVDDTAAREFAFFNPESTVNTTHVTISGDQQPQVFLERRKNPADVLRQAIEREPDRSDLRLKLLELYYTTAAQNRRAFMEVARQLAKSEKLASAKDWSQIADMGRTIAPDDELFSTGGDVDSKVA